MAPQQSFSHSGQGGPAGEIIFYCAQAWRQGLLSGFSGNASVRLGDSAMLITASGLGKGHLRPQDCLAMNLNGDVKAGEGKPSSEWRVHAAFYEALPHCRAILHTHPPRLQALNLILANRDGAWRGEYLNINLYEAADWRKHLYISPAARPGSPGLAANAAAALPSRPVLPCGVWLENHGLCALAVDLASALSFTEQLEHLAKVQLLCLGPAGGRE